MTTLAGIQLPADLLWEDEFAGFGVGQTITPTLTGALVVEESAQPVGRPITLRSAGGAWVTRATVEALATLASTPLPDGATLALTWSDGRSFEVVFDRSSGAGFSAEEVYRVRADDQDAAHPYEITLNLIVA